MKKILSVSVGEFRELADDFLAMTGLSKKELALNLKVEPSYFSKLYNGKKPVSSYILERLKQVVLTDIPKVGSDGKIEKSDNIDGRLDQLTKQIADLQESMGGMKVLFQQVMDRVDAWESKKKPALPVRGRAGSQ